MIRMIRTEQFADGAAAAPPAAALCLAGDDDSAFAALRVKVDSEY